MSAHLQILIGTDKKNPFFSICRDENYPGSIHVYFGAALLEAVPDDPSRFEFKHLIGRLYNAKIKAKSINEVFGIARTTMKRWGDAIKSGDPVRLIEALSGQGAPRKLTPEIEAFTKFRFLKIYQENHYNYSSIIRDEIKEIFKKNISAETLRPIFNELKNNEMVSECDQEGGSGDEYNLGNPPKNASEEIIETNIKDPEEKLKSTLKNKDQVKEICSESQLPIFKESKDNEIGIGPKDGFEEELNSKNSFKEASEEIVQTNIEASNENSKQTLRDKDQGKEICLESRIPDLRESEHGEIGPDQKYKPREEVNSSNRSEIMEAPVQIKVDFNENSNPSMKITKQGECNEPNVRQDEGRDIAVVTRNEETMNRSKACDSNNLNRLSSICIDTQSETTLTDSISRNGKGIRKYNPNISLDYVPKNKIFCHHAGVLIFGFELSEFKEFTNNDLATQLLLTILLGAKNIEQTKILDFNAIKAMLGIATPNLHIQRTGLSEMSTEDNIKELLKFNAKLIDAERYSDFFFDPHTKHYTGAEKILKGWCAGTKSANKIINMDFIHTAPDGYPVYVEDSDNFHDLRERFLKEVDEFREILGCGEKRLTFVVDRGIYSFDVLETIADDEKTHIITWEKGYKSGGWDERKNDGIFLLFKCRNNSRDLRDYCFAYVDRIWEKNPKIRQIIVRATNPKERTIEVSILTDDTTRNAEEIIELIFSRWVQESDFKYENKHFGINEIISYSKVSYEEIRGLVKDKETKRGVYKALEKETDTIRRKLKNALLKVHTIKSTKIKLEIEIEIKKLRNKLVKAVKEKSNTKKEGSKLRELIENNYKRLNTCKKKYMDCIKIIARNIFYKALEPFKEKYDNYRDDHVLFRNLTHAHGVISFNKKEVYATIFPTAHLQPKIRKIIEEVFGEINRREPKLPDGSERRVKLRLGNKENNLLLPIQQKIIWE
ncbi:MAG: hypothetical protein GY909_10750 [Oligoflexia bacterium]|nr:hypothetical protein [Oligoflexia bacterium]